MQAKARPLDGRAESMRADLLGMGERLELARSALVGTSNRQKAQAVASVVWRVVLDFSYYQAGTQERSELSRVVIEPLVGNPKTAWDRNLGMTRPFAPEVCLRRLAHLPQLARGLLAHRERVVVELGYQLGDALGVRHLARDRLQMLLEVGQGVGGRGGELAQRWQSRCRAGAGEIGPDRVEVGCRQPRGGAVRALACRSQRRMVVSAPPVASVRPSPLNARAVTEPACPFSSSRSVPRGDFPDLDACLRTVRGGHAEGQEPAVR